MVKILELEIGDIEIKPYSNFYSMVTPNECRLNNIDYSLEIIIKNMSIKFADTKIIDIEFEKDREFLLGRISNSSII